MENWLLNEMLIAQRAAASKRVTQHEATAREEHGGLRRALASTLVRAGLRLDGDAAGALPMSPRETRREVTS